MVSGFVRGNSLSKSTPQYLPNSFVIKDDALITSVNGEKN